MKKLDYRTLWSGVAVWCRNAGRSASRPVLLMWFVMKSRKTPAKDKWAIFCSLAYLVMPFSLLKAKKVPVLGLIDEAVSLAIMIRKMARYVTPEMNHRADEILNRWFSSSANNSLAETSYYDYEIIEE